MLNRVLEKCEDGTVIPLEVGMELPKNITPQPAPDKGELIKRHRSRFADKQWFPEQNLYI